MGFGRLPHIAGIADDLAVVRSMATNVFNHAPANLSSTRARGSRPAEHGSVGDLRPRQRIQRFAGLCGVAIRAARTARRRSSLGSGFSPTAYQGVPFRTGGEPILNLARPTASATNASATSSTR